MFEQGHRRYIFKAHNNSNELNHVHPGVLEQREHLLVSGPEIPPYAETTVKPHRWAEHRPSLQVLPLVARFLGRLGTVTVQWVVSSNSSGGLSVHVTIILVGSGPYRCTVQCPCGYLTVWPMRGAYSANELPRFRSKPSPTQH